MKFVPTPLAGAYVVELEEHTDSRGFFVRTWCKKEFEENGLNGNLVQCSISFNLTKGILRGMHYQQSPYEESKLVRCTRGKVFDVVVDLRQHSSSYCGWFGVELSSGNRKALYVPEEFAHGFQVLEDNSEVFYQMSQYYQPDCARGVRWDDPTFGISWPIIPPTLSERDVGYQDFVR